MVQRNCIKFCIKNGSQFLRAFEMFTLMLTVAFCKPTTNRTLVQLWYNRFKVCREEVNDDDHPDGRAHQQPMKTFKQ